MDDVKILLVGGSDDLLEALAEVLSRDYSLCTCKDGNQALEILDVFSPDVLVTDLELPGLDGFTLIRDAAARGKNPAVLALTRLRNDYVIDMANQLGIQFILFEPFSVRAVIKHVECLVSWLQSHKAVSLEATIEHVLGKIFEIEDHLDGYQYFIDACKITKDNKKWYITKDVYPEVAKRNDTKIECVERSMRWAVREAWKKGGHQLWCGFFQRANEEVPNNTDFLKQLNKSVKELLDK